MDYYPTYHSPIRLLNELGLDTSEINLEGLKIERKRLLLELQISNDRTVLIGDQPCTKNDVLNIFEELSAITDLSFHQRIYDHPRLLNFLENFSLEDLPSDNRYVEIPNELEDQKQLFRNFVSPYLANAINNALSSVIRNSNFDQFEKLIPFFSYLNHSDALFAFRKFNALCESLELRLNNVSATNSGFPFKDFLYLRDAAFYNIANEVNKHYQELANLIAHTLINFTVENDEKYWRANHLYKIYNQLGKLNCSNELKSIVYQNEGGFRRDTRWRITDTFGLGWRYVIIGSIVGIFVIFAMIFGDLNVSKAMKNAEIQRVQKEKEEKEKEAEMYGPILEQERLTRALKQQSEIGLKSPNRRAEFDFTAFKLFHGSIYYQLATKNWKENPLTQDSLPAIVSPLFFKDSANLIPFGKKARLLNKTNSDMLLIARDRNSLSSYFVPAKSIIRVELDPNSSVFFYSGSDWNTDSVLNYQHINTSLTSDSIELRTTGHFEQSSEQDINFMGNIYILKGGSECDLIVDQIDDKYVFIGRVKNSPSLTVKPYKHFRIPWI